MKFLKKVLCKCWPLESLRTDENLADDYFVLLRNVILSNAHLYNISNAYIAPLYYRQLRSQFCSNTLSTTYQTELGVTFVMYKDGN